MEEQEPNPADVAAAPEKKRRGRPPKVRAPAAQVEPQAAAGSSAVLGASNLAAAELACDAAAPAAADDQQQHDGGAQEQPETQQQQQQQQDRPVKRRGRPPGVKNKQTILKAGTAGPLMAHTLSVQPGEDVCVKLLELANSRTCSLTVLAASGAVSAATLTQGSGEREGAGVGVVLTGHFTILSISGAVLATVLPEATSSTKQFLSASLANSSGGVVGGSVAGPVVAATPVLLVVGLFG